MKRIFSLAQSINFQKRINFKNKKFEWK